MDFVRTNDFCVQVPLADFDVIADIASSSTHKREVRELLLAALAQARSLTHLVNSSLKVGVSFSVSLSLSFFLSLSVSLSRFPSLSIYLSLFLLFLYWSETERTPFLAVTRFSLSLIDSPVYFHLLCL